MATKQSDIFEMLRRSMEEPTIYDASFGGLADANNNFSYDEKKDSLRKSQNFVLSSVDNNYLTSLYTSKTFATTSATFSTSEILSADDIISAKVTYTADGVVTSTYAEVHRIEDKLKHFNNDYLKPTSEYPVMYVGSLTGVADGSTKVVIDPSLNITAIEMTYLQEPDALIDDNSKDYILGDETLNALLYFAEAELWSYDNKPTRSKLAYEKGNKEIETLNERFNPEL